MSWLNLSASRFELIKNVPEAIKAWKTTDVLGTYRLGIKALLTGDETEIKETLSLCEKWAPGFFPKNEEFLGEQRSFSRVLSFSFLSLINGNNQDELWDKLLHVKCKDKLATQLQKFLKNIIFNEEPKRSYSKKGNIRSEKDWLKILEKGDIQYLWNLVSCIDHPLWRKTLAEFFLPILFLYQQYLKRRGLDYSIYDICLNRAEELSGEILYERVNEVSLKNVNKFTRIGFDAVSVQNNRIYVYYWLSFKWKLPLLFPTAFRILEDLDSSWGIVEKAISPETYAFIDEKRKAGECTYVIVYDSTDAGVNEKALKAAKEQYASIDFVLKDFAELGTL